MKEALASIHDGIKAVAPEANCDVSVHGAKDLREAFAIMRLFGVEFVTPHHNGGTSWLVDSNNVITVFFDGDLLISTEMVTVPATESKD